MSRPEDEASRADPCPVRITPPDHGAVATMRLNRLEVSNLRVIETADLAPGSRTNLLVGANGSGKTSLLEAIHLLCTGRSFRSRRAQEFIGLGASETRVHAQVTGEGGESVPVGVEKTARSIRIRFRGSELRSASALARQLPLVVIPPDSQRLVFDGAELRRKLMDWGLFHVEQEYGGVFQSYRRLLRQRNAQLRTVATADTLGPWNAELGQWGEKLHRLRRIHLQHILPRISTLASRLCGLKVSVHYTPGWDENIPLSAALGASLNRDAARGHTAIGPHRADLALRVGGAPAHEVLSRGEAKLVCFALWLAQVKDLEQHTGRTPLVLIDDLSAELDGENRRKVFGTLLELGVQSFVTSVDGALTGEVGGPWKGFHLERGKVAEMV